MFEKQRLDFGIQRPSNVFIVGVAGLKRSGKDTVAAAIEEQLGAQHIAWADPLYDYVSSWFGLTYEEVRGIGVDRELPHPRLGGHSIRECLQFTGTEFFRKYDQHFWVRKAMERLGDTPIAVISGTRFHNEASVCDLVLWIERPRVWWRCPFGHVHDDFDVIPVDELAAPGKYRPKGTLYLCPTRSPGGHACGFACKLLDSPPDQHASEVTLKRDDADRVLINDSSLEKIKCLGVSLLKDIAGITEEGV